MPGAAEMPLMPHVKTGQADRKIITAGKINELA
jgi:hypothetical protein